MFYYIVGILLLAVLIFVHELGHFLFAKWCGVGVLRFSIGFGPSLFSFRHKETTYLIGAIPLGGYVRMVGDTADVFSPIEEDKNKQEETTKDEVLSDYEREIIADRSKWFIDKPIWQRSLIVFAGPLFNLLFAVFLLSASLLVYGKPGEIVDEPVVSDVATGSPADISGVKKGDRIVRVNDRTLTSWEDLAETIHKGGIGPHKFAIIRQGNPIDLLISAQEKVIELQSGKSEKLYLIGISPEIKYESVSLFEAIGWGVFGCYHQMAGTYESLLGMFTGQVSTDELAGPMGILKIAAQESEKGVRYFINLAVALSISLALLNLLPIPVLDGGHLMFFFIEAVAGPVSLRKKEIAQQIGAVALIMLMVFAVHNDIKANIRSRDSHKESGQASNVIDESAEIDK